ncbi:restriction endonuclease subunit S [Planomonospora parontospora]|uniref:restriction endonuclease subunit S n=1 Tax=Planomonospora parontospora TaxID=58119 RepID=UPI00166F93C1|nr:restriction endonuclease subunit S [Planomonospora parontospora]GGL47939.1 hypothetical protein GCM10014719_56500 [Planomonospora parontospora subsp. antibiotica]GII18847.1 hypothetical protein Ppa05_55730 [Planomonospora parontospora subsp. antibiotica]
MTDLPPGWEQATLGDLLLRIEAGKSFTCEPRRADADEWGIIKVSAMTWGSFREEENKAIPSGVGFDPAYEIKPGDILLSRANTQEYVGASVLVGSCRPRLLLSDKSLRLVPSSHVDRRWLALLLSSPSIRGEISCRATGTKDSMRNISQPSLREIRVQVPPLVEQKRIVASLEDHLSKLDVARNYLNDALHGVAKLVRKIRSVEFFGPYVGGGVELLPGWRWGTLEDVLEGIEAGKSYACEPRHAADDEWGVIKVSAMTWGEFREGENKAVPPGKEFDPRYEVVPGDILVSRANTAEYVGAPVLVRECRPRLLLSDKSLRLCVRPDVSKEWLIQLLSSPFVRDQISARATGTKDSMRNISQKALLSVRIPIVPREEQDLIAARIEAGLDNASRLKGEVVSAIRRTELLRRALLREAFAGRLVPQDPSDEPAAELLAGIRAEHAAQPKAAHARRTAPKNPKASEDVAAPPGGSRTTSTAPDAGLAVPRATEAPPDAGRTAWPAATPAPTGYEQGELL